MTATSIVIQLKFIRQAVSTESFEKPDIYSLTATDENFNFGLVIQSQDGQAFRKNVAHRTSETTQTGVTAPCLSTIEPYSRDSFSV